MRDGIRKLGIGSAFIVGCALVWAIVAAPLAGAELLPYELDPALSLTGDCSTSSLDQVPDPICPTVTPKGRLNKPAAVATDPYGDVYVATNPEGSIKSWIDVFDDEGNFLTDLGIGTGTENLSHIAVDSEGNIYGFTGSGQLKRYPPTVYDPEAGEILYEEEPKTISTGLYVGALAVDRANDQLLLDRAGVITRYASAKEGNGVLATGGKFGAPTEAMALDSKRRRLYVSDCKGEGSECFVNVLEADVPFAPLHAPIDGSTTPAGKFAAINGLLSLAVDEESGDLFVGDIINAKTIYRYDRNYNYLSKLVKNAFFSNQTLQIAVSNGETEAGEDSFNRHALFVPVLTPTGSVLAYRPPAQQPPQIEAVSSAGVGQTEAELRAKIKPNGVATEYRFEYTTQEQFEADEYADAAVAGEGGIAGSTFEATVAAQLSGLSPGTSYRFRVVAESEIGEGSGANEGSFTTYSDAAISTGCPNQALRTGASASLPDCRAYELVTPPDTAGRVPLGARESSGDVFPTLQSSPGGGEVSFIIKGGSLPGTNGTASFNGGDRYLATRGASGWSTELAGPSGAEVTQGQSGGTSPDQLFSSWAGRGEGPMALTGEQFTHYLRYPDGQSELVGRGTLGSDPTAIGLYISEGGDHVVFRTASVAAYHSQAVQLEPEAPGGGTKVLYDRTRDPVSGEETTHVVSLLPGDVTPAVGEDAHIVGVSTDARGVAFNIDSTLYLRKDDAVTYEIGTGLQFAGISEGGNRIFYMQAGDLYAFDTNSEAVIPFSASGDVTPVNVATNGARAYFVSPSVLGAQNPEGDTAQPGKQNLYMSEEGQVSFVATVTDRDVEGATDISFGDYDGLGLWAEAVGTEEAIGMPSRDPSRLNADGSVLLFQSRASLDGHATDGAPQIYRYESGANRLQCLSCIPTGLPSGGGSTLLTLSLAISKANPLATPSVVPNLAGGGERAFFESEEALVSSDTDHLQDVYEWEDDGVGSCARPGGCVYLISSGRSGHDNYLFGLSQSGDDVFFTTGDVLTGEDGGGTPSVYDARVDGGVAPRQGAGECLGEACQPAVSPPDSITPASASFEGAGNVQPEPPRQGRCRKGKRRVTSHGKTRCVKKHRHHRKATNGAGRSK